MFLVVPLWRAEHITLPVLLTTIVHLYSHFRYRSLRGPMGVGGLKTTLFPALHIWDTEPSALVIEHAVKLMSLIAPSRVIILTNF